MRYISYRMHNKDFVDPGEMTTPFPETPNKKENLLKWHHEISVEKDGLCAEEGKIRSELQIHEIDKWEEFTNC